MTPQGYLRNYWLWAGVLIVFALGLFVGVQLAHSNSDYVCSANVSDTQTGSCTNGSWSSWTTVSGTLTRTYTGTRSTVSFNGKVTGVSCSHPQYSASQAVGTYTTQYAACQIVETGTQNASAAQSGATGSGTITSTSRSETTGAVTRTTTSSGSYNDYQNMVDAALATSSITAIPSIVQQGNTTTVSWTSNHVKSCTVTGTNGDSWPKVTYQTQTDSDGNDTQVAVTPQALTGSETSGKISEQTLYTLVCLSNLGKQLTSQVTVNIIPVYNVK